MNLSWLLVFIPIAFVLERWEVSPIAVFLASALAIVPLASLMGKSTEVLAHYLGPTYGGLLSATMGNAPELIIGIAALRNGLIDESVQTFDRDMVANNSALLMLATFGLIVPAVFSLRGEVDQLLSLEMSVVLLLAYVISGHRRAQPDRRPCVHLARGRAAHHGVRHDRVRLLPPAPAVSGPRRFLMAKTEEDLAPT